MLYKLEYLNEKIDKLEPVPFEDFSSYGNLEKDLEELVAKSILDILFEEAPLMPIFQERQFQAEADIYALDEKGELIIFELKRGSAGGGAVNQALRYAQEAGQWSFATIQKLYQQYSCGQSDLLKDHKEAFCLEHSLEAKELNKKQRLIIIGNAADESLINAVDYWKKQGLSIDFLPYRIYEIDKIKYFEFFALPYDRHKNPSETKGVLFDTNRSYDEESIWYMMENKCVAAFGDAKRFVKNVNTGDIIFFSHKRSGLIAAAEVKKGIILEPDDHTMYREVKFLTSIPHRGEPIKAMPFNLVSSITGKSFFWARTIKVPYLSKVDSEKLALELKVYLEKAQN
jgi:hypothetical protein